MFCSVAQLLPRSLLHVIALWPIIMLGCVVAGAGTITAYGKSSQGAVPSIKAGTPYAQARKQMLSAGLAPYHVRTYRLLNEPYRCEGREDAVVPIRKLPSVSVLAMALRILVLKRWRNNRDDSYRWRTP